MKNVLLCLILMAPLFVAAQDVIIMKNGSEVPAKVIEINPTQVKYKHFNNQEGPLVIVPKVDVFQIKFENGTVETYTQPTPYWENEEEIDLQAPKPVKLGGPRIGFTVVDPQIKSQIDDLFGRPTVPFYSQFGWQFETQFFTLPDGFSGVFEVVPLIGGFEQGLFLPSLTSIIGVRTGNGLEFGVGPNLSLSGLALVVAGGVTFRSQYVNFPVNLAVVPSHKGIRYSLLIGFNMRTY